MKKLLLIGMAFVALNSGAKLPAPAPLFAGFENVSTREKIKKEHSFRNAPMAVNEMSDVQKANLTDDDAMIYTFRIFSNIGCTHAWYNFPASQPHNYNLIKDFGGAEAGGYGIASATTAKGKTFAYIMEMWGNRSSAYNEFHYPAGIAVLDHETGEFEIKYETKSFHTFEANQLFYDMAYDPVTDEVYACEYAYGDDGSFTDMMNIYTIDQETCDPTFVGQLDCTLTAMAADNGYIYGMRFTGDEEGNVTGCDIVRFNPSELSEDEMFYNEKVVEIQGGASINYGIQAMEFDLTTHRLWWLGFKNSLGCIAEIDLQTGQIKNEGALPNYLQYLAMAIPYQWAADSAPAQVKKLNVAPDADGAAGALITWENPSWDYQLNDLQSLDGVKIYRDEELIATLTSAEPGAAMEYKDSNVPSAVHTYKVVPYNSAGDGLYKEYTVFVGQDVPGSVLNLNYTVNLSEITLTWEAPAAGVNGGWYDESTLKYNVYRNAKLIAENLTATTFTETVETYDSYEYTIESVTSAGKGASSSVQTAFGPTVTLPYENELETIDRALEFNVIDANNDNNTWEYSEGYQGYVYITSLEKQADDYLILPPVNLKAGKKYQVRFYYYTSNYSDVEEKLKLLLGKEPNAESLTTVVGDFTFEGGVTGATWYETHTEYISPEDGVFNFAFKCESEPYMGFVIVSHIKIREMSDTEAQALNVVGPVETYINSPAEYIVTVNNIGLNPIEQSSVRLLELSGNVLAETTIENLEVGETRDVKVVWTPTEDGETQIWGGIKTEGDTYTWDNATDIHLNVKINSEDSDRWLVVGEEDRSLYDNRVICVDRKCGRSQWMFYPDELGGDLTITGLRLHYGASADAPYLTEVPLIVRMANTDVEGIIDSGYNVGMTFMDADGMDVVYEGTVDVSGESEELNILEIKFDTPFEYSSEYNLLIDFEKESEETFSYVFWYMDINPNYQNRDSGEVDFYGDPVSLGRGGFYSWSVPYEEDPWNTSTDYFPYIKFSYTAKGSVETLENDSKLDVNIADGMLNFNGKCEIVEVYNIAGVKLLSEKNVDSVSYENIPSGVYVIKAVCNGNIMAAKVVIK